LKTTKIVITLLILIIAVLLGIEMFTGRSAEPDLTDVTDKKDETSSPIYSETDTSPVNGHSDSSEIPNSSSDIPVSSESDSSDIPDITNLFPFPEKGIPVLMYHSICTDSKNSLCVSEKQFNEEMEWLYNNNYHPLSIDELYNALVQGIQIPEKPI